MIRRPVSQPLVHTREQTVLYSWLWANPERVRSIPGSGTVYRSIRPPVPPRRRRYPARYLPTIIASWGSLMSVWI
ncbi:hypothetical protein J6590_018225 [Homalodisca vitripennis]|nr:hypothetical protein J6590_018225 [Homalodisca vitripennis]